MDAGLASETAAIAQTEEAFAKVRCGGCVVRDLTDPDLARPAQTASATVEVAEVFAVGVDACFQSDFPDGSSNLHVKVSMLDEELDIGHGGWLHAYCFALVGVKARPRAGAENRSRNLDWVSEGCQDRQGTGPPGGGNALVSPHERNVRSYVA